MDMVKVFRFDNPKRDGRKGDSQSNASFENILSALRRLNSNDNSSIDGEVCVTPSPTGSKNDDEESCLSRFMEENEPVDAVIVASSGNNGDNPSVPDSFQDWGKLDQTVQQ